MHKSRPATTSTEIVKRLRDIISLFDGHIGPALVNEADDLVWILGSLANEHLTGARRIYRLQERWKAAKFHFKLPDVASETPQKLIASIFFELLAACIFRGYDLEEVVFAEAERLLREHTDLQTKRSAKPKKTKRKKG